ncbi:MAG: hypothetical protein AAFY31_00605 [Pseudomonadota bacterium]
MTGVNTQPYQAFKLWLAGYVPLDRDLLHVGIGALVLTFALLAMRLRRRALMAGLIMAAVAAFGMEVLDIRDTWVAGQILRWDLSFQDFLRTVAVPLLALLGHICLGRVRKGKPE